MTTHPISLPRWIKSVWESIKLVPKTPHPWSIHQSTSAKSKSESAPDPISVQIRISVEKSCCKIRALSVSQTLQIKRYLLHSNTWPQCSPKRPQKTFTTWTRPLILPIQSKSSTIKTGSETCSCRSIAKALLQSKFRKKRHHNLDVATGKTALWSRMSNYQISRLRTQLWTIHRSRVKKD